MNVGGKSAKAGTRWIWVFVCLAPASVAVALIISVMTHGDGRAISNGWDGRDEVFVPGVYEYEVHGNGITQSHVVEWNAPDDWVKRTRSEGQPDTLFVHTGEATYTASPGFSSNGSIIPKAHVPTMPERFLFDPHFLLTAAAEGRSDEFGARVEELDWEPRTTADDFLVVPRSLTVRDGDGSVVTFQVVRLDRAPRSGQEVIADLEAMDIRFRLVEPEDDWERSAG